MDLAPGIIAEMRAQIAGTDAPECGGLLLGTFELPQRTIRIDQFRLVPAEVRADGGVKFSEEAVQDAMKSAGSKVAGFFHARTAAGTPALSAGDRDLFEKCFRHPAKVFLAISNSKSSPVATYFFWAGDSIFDTCILEFPFDSRLLAMQIPKNDKSEPYANAEPAAAARVLPARWGNYPRAAAAIAAGLLLAGGVAWLAGGGAPRAVMASLRSEGQADSSMGLRLDMHANEFRVSWDRNARLIAAADRGRLVIRDGSNEDAIPLNKGDLMSGSVVYASTTRSVNFRLEVTSPTGQTSRESMVAVVSHAPSSPLSPPSPARVEFTGRSPDRPSGGNADRSTEPRSFYPPPSSLVTSVNVPDSPSTIPAAPAMQADAVRPPAAAVEPPPEFARTLPIPAPPPPNQRVEPTPPAAKAPTPEGNTADAPDKTWREARPVYEATPIPPSGPGPRMYEDVEIQVSVVIDAAGTVISAAPLSTHGPAAGFFVRSAVEAARKWRFEPARAGNRPVASKKVLSFHFHDGRTRR